MIKEGGQWEKWRRDLVFLAVLKSRNASVWTALAGLGTGLLLGKQCFLETLHISANNSEILRNNR